MALSRGSLRVGVTHHRARRSPDFPRPRTSAGTRLPGRLVRPGSYARESLPCAGPGRGVRKLSAPPAGPDAAARDNGRVLMLLPPSETKTRPADGSAPLDPSTLTHPELARARETMLRAARRTAEGRDGGERLGVPASSPELVARMAAIHEEPAGPALSVYSGVLYDQLSAGAVIPEDRRVLVMSALLGVVDAAGDHVPAYRLSAGSRVQRLGAAGPWWSAHLKPLRTRLLEETGAGPSPLVVDSRSGAYRSMLPLRSGHGARVLQVAPVQERGGVRKVISHDAKRYRGIVTRELIAAPELPGDADALVDLLRERLAAVQGVAGAPLGVELDGDQLVVVDPVG